MKRFVLFFFLFFLSFKGYSINRTWNGGAVGNWAVAGNWNPSGIPTASDDLTIDVNATITIDVAPVLSSLLVTNNSSVIFTITNATTGAMTRFFTPVSTSSSPKGFQLDLGSTLTLETNIQNTGSGNLTLRFGAGVNGLINGTLIFNGTLSGTGNPLTTIDLNATSNVQVNGTLQFYSASDNISGGTTINLFFNSGSLMHILKNGGSFPNATWNSNSLAKHTGVINGAPTFSGATYGNVEWNCPSQTALMFFNKDISFNNVNLISTGVSTLNANSEWRIKTGASSAEWIMTINGNLDIGSDARIGITSGNTPNSPGNGAKLHLKGNLSNNGVVTTYGQPATTNEFEIDGTSNQNITNNGNVSGATSVSTAGLTFIMNNVAGATLLSPLTLPANLTLTSGNITTTSTNILTMVLNATYTGGSINSFINGPMKKVGNNNFNFPVGFGDGSGNIYAPIGIINESLDVSTDEFKAEYKRANPQSTAPYSSAVQSGLDHVSYVEYWTLEQTFNSTAVKKVTLDIHQASLCHDLNSTYVSRWDGSQWTNEDATVTFIGTVFGLNETGTIQSVNNISGFTSPNIGFTLATDLDEIFNPLPITLISFDASKLTNNKSSINWELAACCSAAARFEIQRAGTDKNFVTIGTVGSSETNKSYNYIDNGLKNGVNFYRLKMIDVDGKITYSRTVAVMNGVNGLLLTSLIPTVITNNATLTIASSSRQKLDLVIVDMQGRVMLKRNYTSGAGNTNIELSLGGLPAGVYQLTGISAEGKTNTIRFIKQ